MDVLAKHPGIYDNRRRFESCPGLTKIRRAMNKGDLVKHKASGQRMVILYISPGYQRSEVKCRYLNPITGNYEVGVFMKEEIEEAK